jgi:hypothetical protein
MSGRLHVKPNGRMHPGFIPMKLSAEEVSSKPEFTFFWQLDAFIFIMLDLASVLCGTIGIIGVMTMFKDSGSDSSPAPALSMVDYHPISTNRYLFGLNRVVESIQGEIEGYTDDGAEIYSYTNTVYSYESCRQQTENGTIFFSYANQSLPASLCSTCYDAGETMSDPLMLVVFLIAFRHTCFLLYLMIVFIVYFYNEIVGGNRRHQQVEEDLKNRMKIFNFLLLPSAPALFRAENMQENFRTWTAMFWRISEGFFYILGVLIAIVMITKPWQPCRDAIYDTYAVGAKKDRVWDGDGYNLILTFIVISSVSGLYKLWFVERAYQSMFKIRETNYYNELEKKQEQEISMANITVSQRV